MAAMPMSPLSSPRLPSPPPIAEDQLGAKSPISNHEPHTEGQSAVKPDDGASRRIRPGTKSPEMAEGPPLVDISEIESAYQLTEHLKALYNEATRSKETNVFIPITRATATALAKAPKDVDRDLWLYELCRFLCQKINGIIVALFQDDPPCSAQTCSEMRASEWQYLCAVHDPPKACCAIDYCCHTLDSAANVLTSQKHFPSRMSLVAESDGSSHLQLKQLTNIFRRVYRIFAHAWFQHRNVFWKVETKTGLYVFFKTVCDVYGLIPEDNYTVPPEAEGKGPVPGQEVESDQPAIALAETDLGEQHKQAEKIEETYKEPELETTGANLSYSAVNTAKRHRQTPSADLGAILTVLEENEEDDEKKPEAEKPSLSKTEAPVVIQPDHDKPAKDENPLNLDKSSSSNPDKTVETKTLENPAAKAEDHITKPSETEKPIVEAKADPISDVEMPLALPSTPEESTAIKPLASESKTEHIDKTKEEKSETKDAKEVKPKEAPLKTEETKQEDTKSTD